MNKGFTIWFTGPSGAGKTTLSNMLHLRLQDLGITNVEVLDGDVLGHQAHGEHGFTREDVDREVVRIGFVAQLLTKHGIPTLVSSVSPLRESRDEVRRMVELTGGPGSFVEVFIDCAEEVCRARTSNRTASMGAGDRYEPPHNPELRLRTDKLPPEQCTDALLAYLRDSGLVSA